LAQGLRFFSSRLRPSKSCLCRAKADGKPSPIGAGEMRILKALAREEWRERALGIRAAGVATSALVEDLLQLISVQKVAQAGLTWVCSHATGDRLSVVLYFRWALPLRRKHRRDVERWERLGECLTIAASDVRRLPYTGCEVVEEFIGLVDNFVHFLNIGCQDSSTESLSVAQALAARSVCERQKRSELLQSFSRFCAPPTCRMTLSSSSLRQCFSRYVLSLHAGRKQGENGHMARMGLLLKCRRCGSVQRRTGPADYILRFSGSPHRSSVSEQGKSKSSKHRVDCLPDATCLPSQFYAWRLVGCPCVEDRNIGAVGVGSRDSPFDQRTAWLVTGVKADAHHHRTRPSKHFQKP